MSRRLPLRRSRRAIVTAVAGVAVALVWFGAPAVLRRLAFFRVRQVELVGLRHVAPDAVIAALRLVPGASVLADTRLLADRVKGLAGVADARVVRRLPAALRVIVREVEPTAFVPQPGGTEGLMVVDGEARALPFDPARSGGTGALDLPIAETADRGVLGVLALVQAVDPALFGEITAARGLAPGDVLLELGSRRVVVRRDAGPEIVRAVVLVAQDLAARARPYVELDARYAGQVVVRRGRGSGASRGRSRS